MKSDLVRRVGGMLLGPAAMLVVAVLVVLPACGGTTPIQAAPGAKATAGQPARTGAPAAAAPVGDRLAQGKLLFEQTAGGVGCAYCHGPQAKGDGKAGLGAPDIRGKTEAQVRAALAGGVPLMSGIKLTDDEITAVFAYLQYLNAQ